MEDNDMAMVNEKGPCRGEITKVEVRKRVIPTTQRQLGRQRHAGRKGRKTLGRAAAGDKRHGDTFVFGVRGVLVDIVGGLLARSNTKCRIDDKGQKNCAENTDQRTAGVQCNRRQGTRGEGDDGDDDTCACVTGSVFISKTNFMAKLAGRWKEEGLEEECWIHRARVRGRQQGQCQWRYSGDRISMVLGEG
jgi:hypothetical protein